MFEPCVAAGRCAIYDTNVIRRGLGQYVARVKCQSGQSGYKSCQRVRFANAGGTADKEISVPEYRNVFRDDFVSIDPKSSCECAH